MDLLAFELIASPLLLLAATLAVRRWGESVGGSFVGLPLTSGPISLFLALEQGAPFARDATAGSLTATVAQAAAVWVYCLLAARGCVVAIVGACVVGPAGAHRAHRGAGAGRDGRGAGVRVMRGMATGLLEFAVFFYGLSLALHRVSIPLAYGAALVAALGAQAWAFRRLRARVRPAAAAPQPR